MEGIAAAFWVVVSCGIILAMIVGSIKTAVSNAKNKAPKKSGVVPDAFDAEVPLSCRSRSGKENRMYR